MRDMCHRCSHVALALRLREATCTSAKASAARRRQSKVSASVLHAKKTEPAKSKTSGIQLRKITNRLFPIYCTVILIIQ